MDKTVINEYLEAFGLQAVLVADKRVVLQKNAFEQLQAIINQQSHWTNTKTTNGYKKLVITPDFHKGTPVPVGVTLQSEDLVFPALIGGDIGCGMQLTTLEGLTAQDLEDNKIALQNCLREIFFQGQRNVALTKTLQQGLFQYGLQGLEQDIPNQGILEKSLVEKYLLNSFNQGGFSTSGLFKGIKEYIDKLPSDVHYDAQLGTVGGGNHFVEIGSIDLITEKQTAWQWGIKKDSPSIFVHSGSLGFGKAVASFYSDLALQTRGKNDKSLLAPFFKEEQNAIDYLNAMKNAANFAICNRFFMSLMVCKALKEVIKKDFDVKPVWDSAHNLVFEEDGYFVHRKGATPAYGPNKHQMFGDPVLVPGSMGDKSWIMKGLGNKETLNSAPHGAGRTLSRGGAKKQKLPNNLCVVLPVDLQSLTNSGRDDIKKTIELRLKEEAPGAYKDVEAAVSSTEQFEIASRVASHQPILTIKGI